jgi:predicted nucleotidyltransferase
MKALHAEGMNPSIHGSIARGDVDKESDIDVILESVIASYRVELALSRHDYTMVSRKITQATPSHSPKAHIYLDPEEQTSVTFPLVPFRTLESQFYRFGGLLTLTDLVANRRVPGVTKRLTLIEPTQRGHVESAIEGRESEVAIILGVSTDIMRERIRVLRRRDEIGRTGVFTLVPLSPDEQFETVLRRLTVSKPEMRRLQRERKKR